MSINHVFYKNWLIAEIENLVSTNRQQLMAEMVAAGSDPMLYSRRLRMLKQLSLWHAAMIDKISQFETDHVQDYLETRRWMRDHMYIINRNA